MTKKDTISLLFAFIIFFNFYAKGSAQSNAVYFATDPAVSPGGDTIIFGYESDLWSVPTKGGRAVRLTAMEGKEGNPAISPNGKWLAFTSNQYGNNDVYIMPLDGGVIKQLTFHQANDKMPTWGWGSDSLYFESNRYNAISEYAVSIAGGTPKRIFGHYFNTVNGLVKAPNKPVYYFNESWESFRFPQRKRYQGPFNANIKSYNTQTDTYKELTSWEGKDFVPMVDQTGDLYFLSDEANAQFNLYTFKDGQKTQLTHFTVSARHPSISANGRIIAFEKGYQLFTYNTQSGEAKQVPVSISENNTLAKEQSFNVKGNIASFDVSPDGKKLAFESRGELFVSDIEGKFIRELQTNEIGRVLDVKWMKDSQTLIFNQTVDGYQNWFTIKADGSAQPKQLTDEHRNNRMLILNPEQTKGLYLSGRDELRLLDLKTGESQTIVKDEFWGFQNDQPRFSPNGKWVVFTAHRNFEKDIFVYNIESGQKINLTQTGVSEDSPFWGPSGAFIYYSSSRTEPSYPRGGGPGNIYRVALHPVQQPFKSKKYEQLFQEKSDDDSTSKKDISIRIQQDGLMQRIQQVGPSFGSQSSPYVARQGDNTVVLYSSNHSKGQTKLWSTTLKTFESPETKPFEDVGAIFNFVEADGAYYGLNFDGIYKLNLKSKKAEKIEISYTFHRNLRDEFTQMFAETWANIEENYYTQTFNNTNWKKIRDLYATYLPHVSSRAEFRTMMNDMLGELNSSHVGFRSSGDEEDKFYETATLATGLLFENDAPYTVREVVKDSPAALSTPAVKPGDVLIAVGAKKVDTLVNRNRYFIEPEMKNELMLTFERNGKMFKTWLHPTSYGAISSMLYSEWEAHNQQVVDTLTSKRVAYVHLRDMGSGALQKFLLQMVSETYKRDALILDLRYNTGGNVHDAVLHFLEQRPYLKWKYRGGSFAPQPNFAPAAKPIVLLINEQTLSDGEVTAAAFKHLNMGTIIGTHTYKWIIFTSGKRLVDGSFYRLPSWGVYTLDGQNLEYTGVAPDIAVDNTFKDRLMGQDPQLQRAIEFVMKELAKNNK